MKFQNQKINNKVEWDTAGGVPEVQQITSSLNLGTNEVQTITTSVEDIDEIQVITTSAISHSEVQSITVSPIPGEASLNSMLSYSLKLDTIASGGSVEYSGEISATASSVGSSDSLSEILGAMKNIDSVPIVSVSGINPDGGHTYWVTFPTSMKNVPQLEVYLSDLPVSTSTTENANLLEGNFRLEYAGEVTEPIPSDANEVDMQAALESLDSIGNILVTRSDSDDQNGYSWTIQFISELNEGNLDDLIVHQDSLTSTHEVGGATVAVVSGGTDGSYIHGTFTMSFGMLIHTFHLYKLFYSINLCLNSEFISLSYRWEYYFPNSQQYQCSRAESIPGKFGFHQCSGCFSI